MPQLQLVTDHKPAKFLLRSDHSSRRRNTSASVTVTVTDRKPAKFLFRSNDLEHVSHVVRAVSKCNYRMCLFLCHTVTLLLLYKRGWRVFAEVLRFRRAH